jgi:transcriptional regulator with XRE-family HTH domain
MGDINALDILDEEYISAANKSELDTWAPLGKIILESIESRDVHGLSQAALARLMNTQQSVISRFENMGRVPSYEFIARMAIALGHVPGITLYGDYMAVVPLLKQEQVKERALKRGVSTQELISGLLNQSLHNEFDSGDYAIAAQSVVQQSSAIMSDLLLTTGVCIDGVGRRLSPLLGTKNGNIIDQGKPCIRIDTANGGSCNECSGLAA